MEDGNNTKALDPGGDSFLRECDTRPAFASHFPLRAVVPDPVLRRRLGLQALFVSRFSRYNEQMTRLSLLRCNVCQSDAELIESKPEGPGLLLKAMRLWATAE